MARDITERRELHAQLAQSDRLSTMGTLAAGIAHEINNPLSYVLYNIQSLSEDMPELAETMRRCHAALCSRMGSEAVLEQLGGEGSFGPAMFDDVAERFRDALAGTLRIKDIARGLGTFSRVDRGEVVPVSVHHAVEQAINMAYNEIKYRASAWALASVSRSAGTSSRVSEATSASRARSARGLGSWSGCLGYPLPGKRRARRLRNRLP